MPSTQFFLATCLIPIALSGCATLDKNECLSANWYLIGVEDGADGERLSRIRDHREACSDYRVIPDLSDYTNGRREGLRQYCTESIGFSQGLRGDEYRGVCPKTLEDDFLAGYDSGIVLYRATESKKQVERQLRHQQHRLAKTHDAIDAKRGLLITSESGAKNRAELLSQLDQLMNKRERLKWRIHQLDLELIEQNNHYHWLLQRHAR